MTDAAERGGEAVYGDVLAFALATEELRAFMLTDSSAVRDSVAYLTGGSGYGMVLATAAGLLQYAGELDTLSQAFKDTMRHEIDTGDLQAVSQLAMDMKLNNALQTRAQLKLLSKLSAGTDMLPLVPTIRDLAENGV